jgi:TatA/E family protein of Tat protein translocase
MGIDNPVHLIFIAAVALLVLGPRRLPEVARSLGKGIREFREAMSDGSTGSFLHAHHDGLAGAPTYPPPEAEVVADHGGAAVDAGAQGGGWGAIHTGNGASSVAPVAGVAGGDAGRNAVQAPGSGPVGAGDPPHDQAR